MRLPTEQLEKAQKQPPRFYFVWLGARYHDALRQGQKAATWHTVEVNHFPISGLLISWKLADSLGGAPFIYPVF